MQPDTRYAKSGDVHIAYQVFGEGPINLVLASPFVSNVEHWWDEPDIARWLLRLASFARVVMLDKRGTGMSDRVAELPGLDQRIDDLRAVMDAAGMDQAALLGISENQVDRTLAKNLVGDVNVAAFGVTGVWLHRQPHAARFAAR